MDRLVSPLPGIENLNPNPREIFRYAEDDSLSDIRARLQAQQKRYEKLKGKGVSASQEMRHELRTKFQQALNKLITIDTREVGYKESVKIIEQNISQESLRVFLGCLGEIKKNQTSASRECEVRLIGHLAEFLGDKMIEDSYTPFKYIYKAIELIQIFFKDPSRNVHEAAADSLCAVYMNCVPKNALETVVALIYEPLETALTSGLDVKAQQAASLAMFKWFSALGQDEDVNTLNALYPKVLSLFVKLRPEYPDLISCLGLFVDLCGLNPLLPDLLAVLKKLLAYVGYTGTSAHLYKIEACKLLECLGRHLQNLADLVMGSFAKDVVITLEEAKLSKLPGVQIAARQALTEWKRLEIVQAEIEEKKMQRVDSPKEPSRYRPGMNIERNIRQSSPLRRNHPNLQEMREKLKVQKQSTPTHQERSPIDRSSNWGIAKPKFLEKGSGNYPAVDKPSSANRIRSRVINRRPMTADRTEGFFPSSNLVVPRESLSSLNKDVLNVINRAEDSGREGKRLIQDEVSQVYVEHIERPTYNGLVKQSNFDERKRVEPLEKEVEVRKFVGYDNPEEVYVDNKIYEKKYSKYDERPPEMYIEKPTSYTPEKIYKPSHTPTQPQAEPSQSQLNNIMNQISQNFEATLSKMQMQIEKSFNTIEQKLYSLDDRLDGAYEQLQTIKEKEEDEAIFPKKSYIHPPSSIPVLTSAQLEPSNSKYLNSPEISPNPIPFKSSNPQETYTQTYITTSTKVSNPLEVYTQTNYLSPEKNITPTQYETHVPVIKTVQTDQPIYAPVKPQLDPEVKKSSEIRDTPVFASKIREDKILTSDIDPLTKIWISALQDLQVNNIDSAYSKIFNSGDDLYLLRLMHKTGPCVDTLSQDTGKSVLERLSLILNSYFLEGLGLRWITDAINKGLFSKLDEEDQLGLLESLYRISTLPTQDGVDARELYSQLVNREDT
jgi:hypothetical protein